MKLAILGAGAWGSALAIALARHHQVSLWARDAHQVAQLADQRVNQRYLPDCPFPDSLVLSTELARPLQDAELVIIATPMAGLRPTLRLLCAMTDHLPPILWACKGFEVGSSLLPHQVAAEELPADHPCGVLSGPSFAREVAQGLPAALTVAADDEMLARRWVRELHSPLLRLYASNDLVGVEVGGAVKNVMAIATGVADGLNFGLNSRAALITRGLAEISRLAIALGASQQTLMGLSGMGDLILTCTGDLSRNRQVGLQLAQGHTLAEVLKSLGHVAEGVATAREVLTMAERLQVEMPITTAVCGLLYQGHAPQQVVQSLLSRLPKLENGGMLA